MPLLTGKQVRLRKEASVWADQRAPTLLWLQAFAARLGNIAAALLPLIGDKSWLVQAPFRPPEESQTRASAGFDVLRGLNVLVALVRGSGLQGLGAPGLGDDAGQAVEPWLAAVWAGAGHSASYGAGALPDFAARLASAAPWAQAGPMLEPRTRLHALLAVMATHSHLISGEPTEGGMWLWRFVSGAGGQALTSLASRDFSLSQASFTLHGGLLRERANLEHGFS